MKKDEVEKILKSVVAITEIEGFIVTEEEKENGRKFLRGEVTSDEIKQEYIRKALESNG